MPASPHGKTFCMMAAFNTMRAQRDPVGPPSRLQRHAESLGCQTSMLKI